MSQFTARLIADAESGRQFAAMGKGAYAGLEKILPREILLKKVFRASNEQTAKWAKDNVKIVVLENSAVSQAELFDKRYIFYEAKVTGIICKGPKEEHNA